MNKFQEALDIVNERFDYINEELHPNKHYQKPQISLDTLQELIDNYSKLESIYNKYLSIQKECDSWYKTINSYKNKNEKLEKALDKACEIIANTNNHFTPKEIKESKVSWKEYLIKESEKQ